MPIYKTRWFARWARKEGLGDKPLCQAVEEMLAGLVEADLGGNLFKKRIPRLVTMPPPALAKAIEAGEMTEVTCDE